jgi:hypothetical protein
LVYPFVRPHLQLITDLAQQIVSPGFIRLTFYAFGRTAVDDANDTSTLPLSAMMISTGLAVAQNIGQTSGTLRITFKRLMG